MLFALSPIVGLLVAAGVVLAGKVWRSSSRGARVYAALCGGIAGAVAGSVGTELWCWLDRACRTSQGDGMMEVMSLLVLGVGAAAAAGVVGLVAGGWASRTTTGRRVLVVTAPAALLVGLVLEIALAAVAAL